MRRKIVILSEAKNLLLQPSKQILHLRFAPVQNDKLTAFILVGEGRLRALSSREFIRRARALIG